MEENKDIRKDEVLAIPTITPPKKEDIETEAKRVMLDLLAKSKAENAEILAKIDARNKEFSEMVAEAKQAGTARAGSRELTEEDKAKEGARKLIAGTGLERLADI